MIDTVERIALMREVLEECAGYFDARADVTDGDDVTPHYPNDEMALYTRTQQALGKLPSWKDTP
jgi:hypothetical protein